MAKTYVPIETQTLGSAAADFTFSSIPATYTDLVLVAVPKVTSATTFALQFNGSSAANYSETIMYGAGSSTGSSTKISNQTELRVSYGSTSRSTNTSNIIIHILNYSNTTTYKHVLSRENCSSEATGLIAGLWRVSSAINSIKILPVSGGTIIDAGTIFTLYGIKAA